MPISRAEKERYLYQFLATHYSHGNELKWTLRLHHQNLLEDSGLLRILDRGYVQVRPQSRFCIRREIFRFSQINIEFHNHPMPCLNFELI